MIGGRLKHNLSRYLIFNQPSQHHPLGADWKQWADHQQLDGGRTMASIPECSNEGHLWQQKMSGMKLVKHDETDTVTEWPCDVDVEYLSSLMFEAVLMCLHAGRSPRCFCSLRGLAGFGKFYQGYPIYIYIIVECIYIYIFTITYTTMIIYVCFISSRRRLRGTFQDTLCCTILPPHRLAAIETARFMLIKEI